MRFAYADPPYPEQALRHYADEAAADGRRASEVNHPMLVRHLCDDFPDGWALSTSEPALGYVLGLCPSDVRVGAWVKPWVSFKPNVNPAHAWEPVIFRGGRQRTRQQPTLRDWVSANATRERGVAGAKPYIFCAWLFEWLNVEPGDEVVDLFPGSGAVAHALTRWSSAAQLRPAKPASVAVPLG